MNTDIETQVAKIKIGNFKQTTTFVSILAENSTFSNAELYIAMELPLFNPAAAPDCERITSAIASALRRSFRHEVTDNSFENAISQINEELAKLSNIGQSNWAGKLNAVVAVRYEEFMYAATTGNIIAMMLRDSEFINLADSPKKSDPNKTFENFATGKIRLNDIFIFSTTSLFNYVGLEKFKLEIKKLTLTELANKVSEILEQNAGPEIAFGTLILKLSDSNITEDFQADTPVILSRTENFKKPSTIHKISQGIKRHGENLKIISKIKDKLTKTPPYSPESSFSNSGSMRDRLFNLSGRAKEFVSSAKTTSLTKQKKFFIISALVLLVALGINIALTKKYNEKKETITQGQNKLSSLEQLATDAESSVNYDRVKTIETLRLFKQQREELNVTDDIKTKLTELDEKILNIGNIIDKKLNIEFSEIGRIADGETIITTPGTLNVQSDKSFVALDIATNKILESKLSCPENIISGIRYADQKIYYYNGQNLGICDLSSNTVSLTYTGQVPASHEFGGLAYYPTGNKLYSINKSTGQIISYSATDTIQKPSIWITSETLKSASSIAIDGSIYAYTSDGIHKYTSGKASEFIPTELFTPLSGKGKILTQKDFTNIYVLDSGNHRVVIFNKKAELLNTIKLDDKTTFKDIYVDEKNKTIFLLGDGKMYKANF